MQILQRVVQLARKHDRRCNAAELQHHPYYTRSRAQLRIDTDGLIMANCRQPSAITVSLT